MSQQLSGIDPRRIPQVERLLVRDGLAGEGVAVSPLTLPLSHVCRSVRQMTAEMLGFTGDRMQIRRDRRRAECHVRQIAMYACHVALRIPLADIAHAYGRDRTTVRHACAVVEDRRDNPGYDDFVGAVERLAATVFEPVTGVFDDED